MTLALVLLAGSSAAHAQADEFSLSAGLKAWSADWSGFTYTPAAGGKSVLTPVQASNKLVWVPSASARWGRVALSVSGYPATDFRLSDGNADRRQELDLNLAWLVTPGLALSAGYKRLSQRAEYSYEPAGPVLGASASAPLTGTLALYGNLGFGRLKTPAPRSTKDVDFKASYQLAEVGLSWVLPVEGLVRQLSLTAGYRMQVLVSRDAGRDDQLGLDARDITQGLALGLAARF